MNLTKGAVSSSKRVVFTAKGRHLLKELPAGSVPRWKARVGPGENKRTSHQMMVRIRKV